MDLDRIRELLRVVAESDVAEVEIEEGGLKLVVRKEAPNVTLQQAVPFMPPYPSPAFPPPGFAPPYPEPATPATAQPPQPPSNNPSAVEEKETSNLEEVRAPIVGTFYRAPSPDAEVFVEVGDTVSAGQVLCIIEAMKLMNEIEAEYAGTVRKILVENAQPVEFDQPLFAIEPA
ncbi:MAG: acetyl-CoA carboxylase biotin carboxyl carrier protein [Rhodothermales bacterium]|nr:acetyl-CoA carboxylase biotin carboxyl carrier protein [Rhodothermales bacterium]